MNVRGDALTNHRQRVLEFLATNPGRDDDEIAQALQIHPRQTVNIVCRKLHKEGALRRNKGRAGKLVNYVVDHNSISNPAVSAIPRSGVAPSRQRTPLTEDEVKRTISNMLENQGWAVKIAWGRTRGIDIDAARAGQRWIIECKGTGSRPEMQNNYFVGVIGELLQRMQDDNCKHSLAFPDHPKFRRLWSELPGSVKQRLQLTALFVNEEGEVQELAS